MGYHTIVLFVYLSYLLFFSIITFILFLVDKSFSKKEGHRRIKEKTLLFFCSIGGGIGGYFGRFLAHHKTHKIYFSLIINFAVLLQLLLLGAMITFIVINKFQLGG